MNTAQIIQTLTDHLLNKDAELATAIQEKNNAIAALSTLQAQIDAAQASVPPIVTPPAPVWSPPILVGSNSTDLSNWQHTGAFSSTSSSFEVEKFDGSSWSSIGTGINNGDFCHIRSVSNGQYSEWVEFNA